MKKISVLGVACLATLAASAQMQVVKDVEHQLKGDVASYPKAIETLTPAFTNPESANEAQTWYIAGKGAFDFVNNAAAMQRVTGELNAPQVAQYVLDGFAYLEKALPLDTVVDAKGKVKTKYSKDILKQIVNNYTLTADAGQWFYNDVHDYAKAAEAWTLFVNLPKDERYAKAGLKAQPDTIVGMYQFYTGCAYSLSDNPAKALDSFLDAIRLGYDKKEAYDYAITSATQMKDLNKAAEIAQAAYEVYPENSYLGTIINNYLDKKEYDKADQLLDPYLAKDPNNGQVYFLKGIIADQQNKSDEAKALYKKAIDLDANNANALFQYAYKLCQEADAIDQNEGANVPQAQYEQFCQEKTFPLYREAAGYLEKAYQLNENLTDCLTLLRSIYYRIGDETNLERVKAL
ncbi:MAG: tetratricopeptide repeat protein [Muribaculaceae bacterium]|nr:tetratricopeptide repeat protein [Muribaculaceae bacterium]